MPRFRPRFTVRTLAIFVTLVCVYFGAWGPTKQYTTWRASITTPIDDIVVKNAGSPLPLLVWQDEFEIHSFAECRWYYLWFFGLKIPLFKTDGL